MRRTGSAAAPRGARPASRRAPQERPQRERTSSPSSARGYAKAAHTRARDADADLGVVRLRARRNEVLDQKLVRQSIGQAIERSMVRRGRVDRSVIYARMIDEAARRHHEPTL